jgi:two-component system phosphate regulon sensor histidine kinase PhoR
LIQRVRSRLYLLAIALATVAAILAAALSSHGFDADALSGFAWVGLLVLAVALVSGLVTLALVRRSMREVTEQTRNVVRDTSKRVSLLDVETGDELRQLAEWVNFLAEDADRSHTALARERVLLSSVAEGITQGVIAVDGHHRIELLNDAARRMLGVQSTPVGEPLIEFVRVPAVFELIEGNDAATVEIQLPTGLRALLRVANRWGSEGRVLLLEDVTTVRKLENVRRDFVANVSHELRTPVAVIRANAETLLAGAAADPVMGPKLIDGLHRNAERLARIIADLLDLSRLDAGQYRLELSRVPLGAITEQALTGVEPQSTARGVQIQVEIPDDLAVTADPKALDQILVNLLDNAVKYTKASGHVWVAAMVEGTHVRIEIRDDGPGIADKHRARVFERFYRADPSRAREAGGTGLGLSIVKHLAESMGGSVGVEPNSPNGSRFWLKLPRSHT